MKNIIDVLEQRAKELSEIIRETEKNAKEPAEKLRISRTKNQERYYIRPAKGKRQDEIYFGPAGRDRARGLAQADYEHKLNKEARKQLAGDYWID